MIIMVQHFFGMMQEAVLLDVGRFLTGYGIGIFSFVVNIIRTFNSFRNFHFLNFVFLYLQVPVFVAEIAPKNLRGGLTTLNQVFRLQAFKAIPTLKTSRVVAWSLK